MSTTARNRDPLRLAMNASTCSLLPRVVEDDVEGSRRSSRRPRSSLVNLVPASSRAVRPSRGPFDPAAATRGDRLDARNDALFAALSTPRSQIQRPPGRTTTEQHDVLPIHQRIIGGPQLGHDRSLAADARQTRREWTSNWALNRRHGSLEAGRRCSASDALQRRGPPASRETVRESASGPRPHHDQGQRPATSTDGPRASRDGCGGQGRMRGCSRGVHRKPRRSTRFM